VQELQTTVNCESAQYRADTPSNPYTAANAAHAAQFASKIRQQVRMKAAERPPVETETHQGSKLSLNNEHFTFIKSTPDLPPHPPTSPWLQAAI